MNVTNNGEHPFLTLSTGMNRIGKPVVYHGESFLTSIPRYRPADGDKQPLLTLNVSVGKNQWSLLGEEKNHPEGDEKRFTQIILTGEMADEFRDLEKGQKVAFSGTPYKHTWQDMDGQERESVRIQARALVPLSTRKLPVCGKVTAAYDIESNTYETRGQQHTEYRACLVCGTVKSVYAPRQVGASEVTNALVELEIPAASIEAKVNGKDNTPADTDKTLHVSFWGRKAGPAAKILRPGTVIAMTGTMSIRNGNAGSFVAMSVREFSIVKYAEVPESVAAPADMGAAVDVPVFADDDDDIDALPF